MFLCGKASLRKDNFTSKLKLRQLGAYNSGNEYDYAFVWPEHVSCNTHTITYLPTFQAYGCDISEYNDKVFSV